MDRALLLVAILLLAGCASRVDDARDLRLVGTATPGGPFRAPHAIEVPSPASGLNATLTWAGSGAALGMELHAPDGTRAAVAARTNAGQLGLARFDPPEPGRWTLYVVGDVTSPTPYEVRVLVPAQDPVHNVLTREATVRPGSFLELDARMEANASVSYALAADAPVRWDLHSHDGARVRTWASGESGAATGAFVAPAEGVYSLSASPAGTATRVRLDLVGRFESYG